MAENKMADVAKLLGVELGEEFYLESLSYPHPSIGLVFRITNDGVESRNEGKNDWYCCRSKLTDLLEGKDAIKKKPWKPGKGSSYFVPSFLIKECTDRYTWYDADSDEDLYEKGLVCRTEDEARALADELIKMARKMRGMDDGE